MNAAKKKRPVGRPKSKDGPATEVLKFVATKDEREEIERFAAELGLTLSEYIRGRARRLF